MRLGAMIPETMQHAMLVLLLHSFLGCSPNPHASKQGSPDVVAPPPTASSSTVETESAADTGALDADPDGDDDPTDTGQGPLPDEGHFERVGKAPLSLRRICDLTVFRDALYGAHAYEPLDMDGATISRYQPDADPKPFQVAFDWNRPGEPAQKGGAGQGFIRVHSIGKRLYVPDADPPYNGFGITDPGTEGFVFVSDANGDFAPARMPHHLPPLPPDDQGHAGAGLIPRAYHVLDVIRFRGRLYASTGSVPPGERAWHGAAPGALHVANADGSRWTYEVDYPFPWRDGVWRLTFLVRFRGKLFAGMQDFDGNDPNDYVVFDPPAGTSVIERKDVHPTRATQTGGSNTLRWFADGGRLYWIAMSREGTFLRVTQDGEDWKVISFPKFAGRPSDVTRFRGALVVLTERGLFRLDQDTPVQIAKVRSLDGRSPFESSDFFCSAPLAAYRNELYAGGQREGSLYKLVAEH